MNPSDWSSEVWYYDIDLINEFGMKPSAQFKQILARVEEKRLTKQTFTREEAIKLVKKLLNQK